jgi:hypothetical protein
MARKPDRQAGETLTDQDHQAGQVHARSVPIHRLDQHNQAWKLRATFLTPSCPDKSHIWVETGFKAGKF